MAFHCGVLFIWHLCLFPCTCISLWLIVVVLCSEIKLACQMLIFQVLDFSLLYTRVVNVVGCRRVGVISTVRYWRST